MAEDTTARHSWKPIESGTASVDIAPPPPVSETQAVLLTGDIGHMRGRVRVLREDVEELHLQSHFAEWNARTGQRGRRAVVDLLAELADLGFAWRDVARLVNVSVPAIQKWRRGERTTGENRQRVAGLLAACDLVSEQHGVQEVASWFEMPISMDAPVTPIDLWQAQRPDLVFDWASGHVDSEQILTEFAPDWRQKYKSDFEVFRAGDGQLSIRPKDG